MSNKNFLPLPTGNNDFTDIRAKNRYYVDKSPYLKTVFSEDVPAEGSVVADGSAVLLFTRPRRFGKTLLMDMFESFLKISESNPGDTSLQKELFKGLKILEDKEFCEKYMGRFPVIFISLKDVGGTTFEATYKMFADTVYEVANQYKYLLNSTKLDDDDKAILRQLTDINYLEDDKNSSRLKKSLKHLSAFLYKEYGIRPILLIDEYDVPLAKASYHDSINFSGHIEKVDVKDTIHYKMVDLMSGFLGILKDKSTLTKTVITGCLKVAKNSIFTGVNNLKVNTIISENEEFTGMIGFTKDETLKVLKDYEMEDYSTLVKNHYDGYRFCDKEMFCPWDVINFIDDNFVKNLKVPKGNIVPGNYWNRSSSDSVLREYIGYLTDTDTQKMQDLIDGKSIIFKLNDSMNYDTLSEHNSNDFWSLLLHTGYLTVDWNKTDEIYSSSDNDIFARIPNKEIKECFTNNIQKRFETKTAPSSVANKIACALMEGNSSFAQTQLRQILRSFISIRDSATKAPHENYYHGYLNGLFTNCSLGFFGEYHSNSETGDGYADITFCDAYSEKAVIIEIKSTKSVSELIALSEEAVLQIEEKHYADHYLKNLMVQSIYAYGIAFSGKNCFITCKKIK